MRQGAAASITVAAPAKLNLCLHVIGRRADGYHRLQSLVAFTEFGDTITAAPAERLELDRSGPEAASLPPPDSDLIARAANALAAAADRAPGARLALVKRLPIGAGIGGGSSDAAAALRALMQLWTLDPYDIDLAALALKLGADVPVCLAGRPALMGGIGEELTFLPALPPAGVLLVNPRRPTPTAEVFRRYAARPGGAASRFELPGLPPPASDFDALIAALQPTGNDLAEAAMALVPEIAAILPALESLAGCRLARMSGSGATCFGLFADQAAAEQAADALRAQHPAWWIVATRLRDT